VLDVEDLSERIVQGMQGEVGSIFKRQFAEALEFLRPRPHLLAMPLGDSRKVGIETMIEIDESDVKLWVSPSA